MLYIVGPVSAPDWSEITAFRVEVSQTLLDRVRRLQQVVADHDLFLATLLDGTVDYFALGMDAYEDGWFDEDQPFLHEMREDDIETCRMEMCQLRVLNSSDFAFEATPKHADCRNYVTSSA